MARIQTMTIIDDLDGREIDAEDARTVSWTWMGVDYELDVSPTNLTRIEEGKITVAKLLATSTRVGGRRRSRSATSKTSDSAARSAQIREWALANGFDVSMRGRIPAHIVDAFTAKN
ncbi:Lsr2 family protein [Gordonia sp. SMJS1]|uniref:histone-like nucleoid-structuring protein Lsr2 n=1 Tax=Gordonia sp. SMJS1 TaxID=3039400 RepID=UPI0024538BCC|nr:Lsr2 family protein [Gordonia sp. SMJS1]WGJ88218.1 Lsr2 family protein [Gordonia sp. SMJS1]